MLVVAAPGQGAQVPGFLSAWLELPAVADRLARYSEVAHLDLAHFGTEADADTIKDTRVAQPLLVAAALAIAPELRVDTADLVTGHSVGELAAAALSGALTAEQSMTLVTERGRAMADAAAITPTGMTACLGGDRDEVLAALDAGGLTPANDNGPGQIVAAGTLDQLQALADQPPARTRLIPLSVAGAFHTTHMAPAVERLAAVARDCEPTAARIPIVSNRDGAVVSEGAEILQRLVGQVANPVRWDLCMTTLIEAGVTGLLELTPAGTLVGIARRAMKGVETFAVKSPDDIDAAREFVANHATGGTHR